MSRERAVLTPVESVSIEVRRSNGRLDLFFCNPLWSDRAGLRIWDLYERPPCRGQGVGQLASDGCAICTVTPPFLGRTAREKPVERRRTEEGSRGCGGEAAAASVHRGLADGVDCQHCSLSVDGRLSRAIVGNDFREAGNARTRVRMYEHVY